MINAKMSKIIVTAPFLFILLVGCTGIEKNMESTSKSELMEKSKTIDDKSKSETKTKSDIFKKENELKLPRKAKRHKETNHKRALELVLPTNNSDNYKRFFEELLKNSNEMSQKQVEDVVVKDIFINSETNDTNKLDPQVEEIEMVIEHIRNIEDYNKTNNENNESTTTLLDYSLKDLEETKLRLKKIEQDKLNLGEKAVNPLEGEKQDVLPTHSNGNVVLNTKGRSGMDVIKSTETEPQFINQNENRKILEPYSSLNRIGEFVMPKYRITMPRSRMMIRTTAPIIDNDLTFRNWITNRAISPENLLKSGDPAGNPEMFAKLINDYNDYNTNTYLYSPDIVQERNKPADVALQPPIGNPKSFGNYIYPAPYFQQPQHHHPDSYRLCTGCF